MDIQMPRLSLEELEEKRKAFEESPEYFLDCRKTLLVVDKKELEPGKTAYMVIPNLRSISDCMMTKGHVDEICDMTQTAIRMQQQQNKKSGIIGATSIPSGHGKLRNFLSGKK